MTRTLLLLFLAIFICLPAFSQCGVMAVNPRTHLPDCTGVKVVTSMPVLPAATVAFSATPNYVCGSPVANTAFAITVTGDITAPTIDTTCATPVGMLLQFQYTMDNNATKHAVSWPAGFSNAIPVDNRPNVVTVETLWYNGTTAYPQGYWTSGTGVNSQTGANYAITAQDTIPGFVNLSNAAPQTPTLPNANTMPGEFLLVVSNSGAGTQTITPSVSTFQNGVTSIALLNGESVCISTDGTNYFLGCQGHNPSQLNGATIPASANVAGTNSSKQIVAATAHGITTPLVCAAAGASGTAYTCSTTPTFVPAAKDTILFCPDVANTGASTLVVNSQAGTPAIQKQQGQAALVANDLRASPVGCTPVQFDGTNWQTMGISGNSPPGTAGRWAPCLDSTKTECVRETFSHSTTATANPGDLGWTSSLANNGAVIGTVVAGHPGIITLSSSTTASGNGSLFVNIAQSATSGFFNPTTDLFDNLWIARTPTNDANLQTRFGMHGNALGSGPTFQPTDGVYFEKLAADTSWFGVCRVGGAQTRTTAVAAVDTSFHEFHIIATVAGTIQFSIDAGTPQTCATNVPNIAVAPFATIYNNGSVTDERLDLDYMDNIVSGLSR